MMLKGRVAIVTGASRGLGEGISRALALAGATVAMFSRDLECLRALEKELAARSATAFPFQVDVAQTDQVQEAVDAVLARFDRVDILVINVSSVTGPMVSGKGLTAYSASKGALSGFTRALALEVAEHGINVNAILPGTFDTPMMRDIARHRSADPEKYLTELGQGMPLGRLGSQEEMGDLAVFLASDSSRYITGAEIVIDGGNVICEH